jgi:hypothetical protein
VTDSAGQLLSNAPVTFAVADGGACSRPTPAEPLQHPSSTTGSDGMVGAFISNCLLLESRVTYRCRCCRPGHFFASSENGQPQGFTVLPGDVSDR